jgi:hypothetical protein
MAPVKFNAKAKQKFLEKLREIGLKNRAAECAGVNYETVRVHCKADPEYAAQVDEAWGHFRELLEAAAYKRAVDGIPHEVPTKDGIIFKTVYSDRLLELMLKRHIPQYREKQQIDMKHSGGVLIVPGSEESSKEWEARHRKENGNGDK